MRAPRRPGLTILSVAKCRESPRQARDGKSYSQMLEQCFVCTQEQRKRLRCDGTGCMAIARSRSPEPPERAYTHRTASPRHFTHLTGQRPLCGPARDADVRATR
jgi:hypothetical protein